MNSANSKIDELDRNGLQPGQHLGRYELLSLVASGGMAQIWAAKPHGSYGFSRTIVLKVIRPEYASDVQYRKMLIDEAAACAVIQHPNVCEVFELGTHNDILFIAMEWIPGDSLAGLMRHGHTYVPFSYAMAAKIVAEACAGLHAAHEAVNADGLAMGIVHRDISPQNVLLSTQGHIKISDFGIAKARDQLHARTQTGEIKGKFAYIAPEQILGGDVDRRADIYSMGCVLFVATLGLRPFGHGAEALNKIVRGDYRKPSEVMPAFPAELEAIIVKALSNDVENRFPTAEAMQQALEHWLAREDLLITHADISRTVADRLTREANTQIQALRSANRFESPQSVRKPMPSDSWELPTAVSGILPTPDSFQDSGIIKHEAEQTPTHAARTISNAPTWKPAAKSTVNINSTAPPVSRRSPNQEKPLGAPSLESRFQSLPLFFKLGIVAVVLVLVALIARSI